MVWRASALAVREAAVMVWWRRTPVEGGETGTGGGVMCCEDMARGQVAIHTSHMTLKQARVSNTRQVLHT